LNPKIYLNPLISKRISPPKSRLTEKKAADHTENCRKKKLQTSPEKDVSPGVLLPSWFKTSSPTCFQAKSWDQGTAQGEIQPLP
jgi:hypothetical protein